MSTALLLIDAQVDFCDPGGSLFVPGADEDMLRLAEWFKRSQAGIDQLVVTLDTHHVLDIAHPAWWINAYGGHPVPFSTITLDDLKKGKYNVSADATRDCSLAYLDHLERVRNKTLMIWPPHCLLGSPGHALFGPLRDLAFEWESERARPIEYVLKGLNPQTEHYSALQAEKVDPNDPSTALNGRLIHLLDEHDRIYVAGEAQSHSVADTVMDLMEHIDRSKFVLIEDGMSNMPGFDQTGIRFLYKAKGRGATITETSSV